MPKGAPTLVSPLALFLDRYDRPLADVADLPVTLVSPSQASACCTWIDARLPVPDEYRLLNGVQGDPPAVNRDVRLMAEGDGAAICASHALPARDPRVLLDQGHLPAPEADALVTLCPWPPDYGRPTVVGGIRDTLGSVAEWAVTDPNDALVGDGPLGRAVGGSWLGGITATRPVIGADDARFIDTGFRCAKDG
ncbi:MAG: hypothetical protein AAFQ50_13915 [Pseudomonadota bacterium]